eukprot:scaffold111553_cov31-Tisochrysis_lutea.AAC.3
MDRSSALKILARIPRWHDPSFTLPSRDGDARTTSEAMRCSLDNITRRAPTMKTMAMALAKDGMSHFTRRKPIGEPVERKG